MWLVSETYNRAFLVEKKQMRGARVVLQVQPIPVHPEVRTHPKVGGLNVSLCSPIVESFLIIVIRNYILRNIWNKVIKTMFPPLRSPQLGRFKVIMKRNKVRL